jgi:hypothetical protein
MKLYHATRATRANSALENAENIVEGGFEASFDYNHQAEVVCFADRPLAGWGGWSDAWVVVDVPDDVAAKGRYEFDDDLYRARCYAFPDNEINKYPRRATENR